MYVNGFNDPQIPKVEVNGRTSWAMMYALTRILQRQIGITTLSDNFGPGTLAALQATHPLIGATTPTNIIKTVQAALYCKGYDGANIDGSFANVSSHVGTLKTDMGFTASTGGIGLTPKMVKGLMTMDPFVLIAGGDSNVRAVQQWMNARYISRADFFVIPCDGYFSRDVQRALMFAIQYQIGMADGVANGFFGPGTQSGIRANTLTVGSTGTWVRLFTAALIFNRRVGAPFSDSFTSQIASIVSTFQQFTKLPVTNKGDFQTWASLLVSTGDVSRMGTAVDCITTITPSRAASLVAANRQIVGRYLSNAPGSTWNKQIEPGEIATITAAGMRVFPIYQTWGGAAAYFNAAQGQADALAAIQRLLFYGFKPGTTVYFAVDFDALDYQVTENIIPHFRGIKSAMDFSGRGYKIGIYGPRNVCSRVAAEGLSSASFVCDMSTGFSGNLGFPLPADWAFDQISTITVGEGNGTIEIDNNIASGRDLGQNSFNPSKSTLVDVLMDPALKPQLLADVRAYLESIGVAEEGLQLEGAPVVTLWSNTQAVEMILRVDSKITEAANRFKLPKSLVQCPFLWEYRKFTHLDVVADQSVRNYYASLPNLGENDSSTGLGQMKAATAIRGQNHCINMGLVQGSLMDPANESDLWTMWQRLQDESFAINMAPQILLEGANELGIMLGRGRPEFDYQQTLARYNGTGPAAEKYGQELIGLYRVLEKYNGFLRNR